VNTLLQNLQNIKRRYNVLLKYYDKDKWTIQKCDYLEYNTIDITGEIEKKKDDTDWFEVAGKVSDQALKRMNFSMPITANMNVVPLINTINGCSKHVNIVRAIFNYEDREDEEIIIESCAPIYILNDNGKIIETIG
jgi:hypothetical protein